MILLVNCRELCNSCNQQLQPTAWQLRPISRHIASMKDQDGSGTNMNKRIHWMQKKKVVIYIYISLSLFCLRSPKFLGSMQLSGTLLDLSQQQVNGQVSLGYCTSHQKLLTPESSFQGRVGFGPTKATAMFTSQQFKR